jgi:hypothetical protein
MSNSWTLWRFSNKVRVAGRRSKATQQQSGRSTIEMTLVTPNDPAVLELCSKQGQDPRAVTSAAKLKWEGTMEGTTQQETNSGLIVAVGDPTQGKLLRTIGNFGTTASQGHYSFGDGGEFILVSQDKDWVTTERVWFESDNVRLRHTKIQYPDDKNVVSFCSEVRVLPPKS